MVLTDTVTEGVLMLQVLPLQYLHDPPSGFCEILLFLT